MPFRILAPAAQGRRPASCVKPTVPQAASLTRWQPHSGQRGPNG